MKYRVCVQVKVLEPVDGDDEYEDVEAETEDEACETAEARVKDRLLRKGVSVHSTNVEEEPELLG